MHLIVSALGAARANNVGEYNGEEERLTSMLHTLAYTIEVLDCRIKALTEGINDKNATDLMDPVREKGLGE
jgi:hypothetical protein